MKQTLLFFLTSANEFNSDEDCFPDKGIKTAIITGKDGRPSKIKSSDGMIQILEYLGSCEKELITTLNPEGDTIQQNQSKFKDGVLIETTWTLFNPVKSIRTSKYFGYKFDKSGHWIKRNYAHQGKEVITETRKLTYY